MKTQIETRGRMPRSARYVFPRPRGRSGYEPGAPARTPPPRAGISSPRRLPSRIRRFARRCVSAWSGQHVRIRFDERVRRKPLTIGAARIALATTKETSSPAASGRCCSRARPAQPCQPGAPLLSDAIDLPVKNLASSLDQPLSAGSNRPMHLPRHGMQNAFVVPTRATSPAGLHAETDASGAGVPLQA